jgi:hypothetical protein
MAKTVKPKEVIASDEPTIENNPVAEVVETIEPVVTPEPVAEVVETVEPVIEVVVAPEPVVRPEPCPLNDFVGTDLMTVLLSRGITTETKGLDVYQMVDDLMGTKEFKNVTQVIPKKETYVDDLVNQRRTGFVDFIVETPSQLTGTVIIKKITITADGISIFGLNNQ